MKPKPLLALIFILFFSFVTSYALKENPSLKKGEKKELIDAVPISQAPNLPALENSEMPTNKTFPYPLASADTCIPNPPTSNPNLTPVNWDEAGWTRYDEQQIGSMGRMIEVDARPGYYNRSFVWTMLFSGTYPGQPLYVAYNRKTIYESWFFPWSTVFRMTEDGVNAGYPNVDVLSTGRAVVSYHNTAGDPYCASRITVFHYTTGAGTCFWYDIPDTVPGHNRGIYAKVQIDQADTMHIIMSTDESPNLILYQRCYLKNITVGVVDTFFCQAPGQSRVAVYLDGWSEASLTGQPAIVDTNQTISAIVATSPVSGKVAIVYTKSREGGLSTNQLNNDVYYIESTNYGRDWMEAGGFVAVPKINVTQYQLTDMERAYNDLSAAYDYDDNLHIIWSAHWYDEAKGLYSPKKATLRHWSSVFPPGLSNSVIIAIAQWDGTNPGALNRNISRISIGVKSNDDAYGSKNYLYAIWSQADTGDSAANGYSNFDIYGSASTDGGRSWDGPWNLTNTNTPNCEAGKCCSEHWSSMATFVDSTIHIQYILDKDPGSAVLGEGAWTNNPVQYLRIHTWKTGDCFSTFRWVPSSIGFPVPRKVANGPGVRFTDSVKLTHICDLSLLTIDSVKMNSEAASWTTFSGLPSTPFNIPPYGQQNFSLDMVPPIDDRIYIDTLFIYSNDWIHPVAKIKIHLIKSDSYFEPEWRTLGDSLLLTIGNTGNMGHQIDTKGLYLVQEDKNFLYDGSPFLASIVTYNNGQGTVTDTAVARYIFNDLYFGAAETLAVYDSTFNSGDTTINIKGAVTEFYPDVSRLKNSVCHAFWGKKIIQRTEIVTLSLAATTYRWVRHQKIENDALPPPYWTNPPSASFGTIYTGELADFDVPSDSGAQNWGGIVPGLNLAYLQGYNIVPNGPEEKCFAGISYLSSLPFYSAYVTRNDTMVWPHSGYYDPQLYQVLSTPGSEVKNSARHTDRNIIMTAKALSSSPDTTEYIWAVSTKGVYDFKKTICQAFNFYGITPPGGDSACILCLCGDANQDGVVDIADIVCEINFVFYGGPEPQPNLECNDVNNDGVEDIGDIVFKINYVFYGGIEPDCGF